jgi:hypothetical protein
MFTKVSLVLIGALLLAILMNQRSHQVAHAQGSIEYKVVDTGILVTADGKPAGPNPLGLSERVAARGAKLLTTQDALDEYGEAGWQPVTHSFAPSNGDERLVFMKK